VTEAAISEAAPTPIDIQYYNLDTRDNYYHALRILSGIVPPDSSQALIEYFKDTRDLFLHTTPVISFVAKPGTIMTPLIERLLPLLEREGLKVVHLIKEDSSVVFKNVFFEPTLENLSSSLSGADLVLTENFGADAPNKIEILRKYWSETPLSDEKDLIAVFADFPYHAETSLPVFDLNKPKNIVTFLREYLGRQ
jgi:molybdopterin-guanine dinucleotide biosynthesis protein B/molybdopterin-guanine dinucleotide biosynthesis protein